MERFRRIVIGMLTGGMLLALPFCIGALFASPSHNDWGSERGWAMLLALVCGAFGAFVGGIVAGVGASLAHSLLIGAVTGAALSFWMKGFLAIPGAVVALVVAAVLRKMDHPRMRNSPSVSISNSSEAGRDD